MVSLILISLPSFGRGHVGVYNSSSTSGQHYDIPYRLTNGTLGSIDIALDTYTIAFHIEEKADGVLDLKIPPDLGNKFTPGSISIFVDEEEVHFQEILSREYRTVVVPVSEGSRSIEIVDAMPLESCRRSELSYSFSGNVNSEWSQFKCPLTQQYVDGNSSPSIKPCNCISPRATKQQFRCQASLWANLLR